MRRLIFPMAWLCLAGLLAGCATMSEKECQNADWHALGYSDGAQGRPAGYRNAYDKRCAEYKITPDDGAYRAGWGQGIRTYCTNANGYNAGRAGQAYRHVCPPAVAAPYRAGYRQGIEQYCAPHHGLRMGLTGRAYAGVCPADMAGPFLQRYRLGRDVRRARERHEDLEHRLNGLRAQLRHTKDEKAYHERLEDLSHLRHEEEESEARFAGLTACASGDWFEAGLSDGEDGRRYRAAGITHLCADYGVGADPAGYRDGWRRGNAHYCSFDAGLYAGQAGLAYHNVCKGRRYRRFWFGYMQGLESFREGRYADQPRPHFRRETRRAPPPRPAHRNRVLTTPVAHVPATDAPGHGNPHGDPHRQRQKDQQAEGGD